MMGISGKCTIRNHLIVTCHTVTCHTFGGSAIEYQSVSKTDEVGHAGKHGK